MEPAAGPADGVATAPPPDPGNEILPLLVRAVVDYAIFALDPDGVVATWNAGAERLKGYRAEEIIGHHFSRFYTDGDRRRGVPEAGLRHAREQGRWENEGWRLRQDGSTFWADVVITALRDGDGRLVGFAKVTRDLTERKGNEEALRQSAERERQAADRLRQLDRMKNELVAVIAHDLREPITVIRRYLEVLSDEWAGSSDEEKLQTIARVATRAEDMGDLVDDVLDLAHIETGRLRVDPVPVDLTPTIERVAADVAAMAPQRTLTVTVGDARALADPQRTWQVLVNLVANALKFSADDTPLEITADRVDHEVVVSVTDHGSGIPEDQRSLLFQPFSRLPGSIGTSGSGIGLSIARSIVEAQEGRIWVESALGVGSTFGFALPAAP